MTFLIDFFPGFDITNLTSICIEIIIGIAIGLLIYSLDRRNSSKQEEIISRIGKYTATQEKGLRFSKMDGLFKINLKLIQIIMDYRRGLAKISIDDLQSDMQLYYKNSLLKNKTNEEIATEIREEGYRIAHLDNLAGAAVLFADQLRMLSMTKTQEDESYLQTKMNISADSIIEFAEKIKNAIDSERTYKIRESK